MNTLHIGLLLPSSSIFPMGKLFEKGIKDGLSENNMDKSIEITKEFIGQGGAKQTEDTTLKLFNYDDVDMITGILSNKVAEGIAAKFSGSKKPLLNNLGENVPMLDLLNPYIFSN